MALGVGGSGRFTGTIDVEQTFYTPFLISGAGISGTYTLDTTTGRGTGTSTAPGPAQFVMWIVNSTTFILMESDSTNPDPVMLLLTQ